MFEEGSALVERAVECFEEGDERFGLGEGVGVVEVGHFRRFQLDVCMERNWNWC